MDIIPDTHVELFTSVYLLVGQPSPPGIPDIDEVTASTVALSWTPPISDGGSPISHYIVERRSAAFRTWMDKTKVLNTSYVMTKLPENQEHVFRVRAVNEAGFESDPSRPSIPAMTRKPARKFAESFFLPKVRHLICLFHPLAPPNIR